MSKSGEAGWKGENLGKRRWVFLVFLGILILHGLTILVFTTGFLLTRTELSQFRHCSDIQQSPCFSPPQDDQMVNHSKGKVLHKLASQPGSFAKIFKAIADPPATSLQRLKRLTTGGLPTFIDAGDSFGELAIIEDNLIYQMAKNGMMGDDTWVQLFPQHFNVSHPFPSFNVKDLDTVDNGCIVHLFPYLCKEDWDVLIAHFVGVNHAGHIFGVDSTETIENFDQYNGILEKVVDVLESRSGPGELHEKTLLLVKKRKICTSSIEQLDFAATVSALLGIPCPFGSIGCVNPELYALAASTWNLDIFTPESRMNISRSERNTCQVKRYIDVYSASSVVGFSDKDIAHASNLYEAVLNCKSESRLTLLHQLKKQVEAYSNFLSSIAALARSKWTDFNLKMMGTGFCIVLLSLFVRIFIIKKLDKLCSCYRGGNFAMLLEGLLFVLVVPLLRFGIELGQSKLAVNSLFLKSFASWTVSIDNNTNLWICVADILPSLAFAFLAYMLYKSIRRSSCRGIFNSSLGFRWYLFSPSMVIVDVKSYRIPRIIYVIGLLQLLLLAISQLCGKEKTLGWEENTIVKATAMLSAWSSTIIILSGKQRPLVALAAVIQGWVHNWLCLFFCTGHWCAFNGLCYAAAFVGFDEFNLVHQDALLTIDTFGFSHILLVLGLSLIVAFMPGLLMYGVIMATSMTLTMICVTIQKRHLMLWSLFAPKFVFDAVGLLLTDFFICFASLYYFPLPNKS
ncbi:unnamed protein product [Withania somnifera]